MTLNHESSEEAEAASASAERAVQERERLLVEAAAQGDAGVVKSLIEGGAHVDADSYNKTLYYLSQNYLTPLMRACQSGHTHVVDLLLHEGADSEVLDKFDVSAVHFAAEGGHLNCLKLLLDAGANANGVTKYLRKGWTTATPYPGGTTPLHLAALKGHPECIRELILNGADYNAVDELGRTSLYVAAASGLESSVLAHLDNAVGRDILSIPVKDSLETPLHECVRHGLRTCVRRLLALGSDVHSSNANGNSPFHLAMNLRSDLFTFEIVRDIILYGYNTNVNQIDRNFKRPLQYVAFDDVWGSKQRSRLTCLLIAYGARIDVPDKHGRNLLQAELHRFARDPTADRAILELAVKTMDRVPSLASLNLRYASVVRPQLVRHPGIIGFGGIPPRMRGLVPAGRGRGRGRRPDEHEAPSFSLSERSAPETQQQTIQVGLGPGTESAREPPRTNRDWNGDRNGDRRCGCSGPVSHVIADDDDEDNDLDEDRRRALNHSGRCLRLHDAHPCFLSFSSSNSSHDTGNASGSRSPTPGTSSDSQTSSSDSRGAEIVAGVASSVGLACSESAQASDVNQPTDAHRSLRRVEDVYLSSLLRNRSSGSENGTTPARLSFRPPSTVPYSSDVLFPSTVFNPPPASASPQTTRPTPNILFIPADGSETTGVRRCLSNLTREMAAGSAMEHPRSMTNPALVWYEAASRAPPSLQHAARCCIRAALGPLRIREIHSLQIPTQLKKLLLLDCEDAFDEEVAEGKGKEPERGGGKKGGKGKEKKKLADEDCVGSVDPVENGAPENEESPIVRHYNAGGETGNGRLAEPLDQGAIVEAEEDEGRIKEELEGILELENL